MDPTTPTTPAEHALLAAAHAGKPCDLCTARERTDFGWTPTPADAAGWDEGRVVRADYLRHLLVDQQLPVHLTGARIDGDLDLSDQHITLSLPCCVLTGHAAFGGTTFTGYAGFVGATFTGDARFNRVTFTGYAGFVGATFTGVAWFAGATFTGHAGFGTATFTGNAGFGKATFTGNAGFDGATFTRNAGFDGATFTGDARFNRVTFTGYAGFVGATFTGYAGFGGVTFTGNAGFVGARFRMLNWDGTRWSAAQVSTDSLVAEQIVLDRAVFESPMRLDVTAGAVSAHGLRAVQRLHLVVAGATVDLADADLAAGSLIEAAPVTVPTAPNNDSGTWVSIPATDHVDGTTARFRGMPEEVWAKQIAALQRLDRLLTATLTPDRRASITSLRRAHVAGVTLSGLDLRECTFAAVDGLDELVLSGDDVLATGRDGHSWPRLMRRLRRWGLLRWLPLLGWLRVLRRTDRRVIVDELVVRGDRVDERPDSDASPLTARTVSATYRSLRKALEDSKDEPGAADFYYGEMEMRRLAAPLWSVERWLLTAYWMVSGYGLRAWRAVATLAVVIAIIGWAFTATVWAHTTTTPAPTSVDLRTGVITSTTPPVHGLSLWHGWLFAAQEAISLFRPSASGVTLTGFGWILDIAVRVLGPVLLALAVLAIRNRTKR